LREHALAAGRDATVALTWRDGSRGPLTSGFLAIRVRPAGRRPTGRLAADGSLPAVWLLAEWPAKASEPTDYWLSDLPETTALPELVRLAKIRWRIEHDYRELKTGLGLDHFEGRTFAGWHRHVTLVTAAQLFLTLLRSDPKAAAPV
jgi:SRSO17 transposase